MIIDESVTVTVTVSGECPINTSRRQQCCWSSEAITTRGRGKGIYQAKTAYENGEKGLHLAMIADSEACFACKGEAIVQ
jgi:hypothetical protein